MSTTFGQKRCPRCGERFPDDQLLNHGCSDPMNAFKDQPKAKPPVDGKPAPVVPAPVSTEAEKEKEFQDI